MNDQDLFGVNDLDGDEVIVDVTTSENVEQDATVTEGITVATTPQISKDDVTLAQTLIEIKAAKLEARGIIMQEPSETPFLKPIVSSQQPSQPKDKGKAKMVEELAFQTLKDKLCDAPVLALSDRPEDFVVYCDMFGLGLGCVLMQRGEVIAYASRQLKIYEKNYTS
nr:putative reverse transcriptase domain-containing protein [Tanacetum cinerariifolium]